MAPTPTIAHRVFFSDLAGCGDPASSEPIELSIDGPEAHHAVRAKRLRVGEFVEVFDGAGIRALGRITGIQSGKRAELALLLTQRVSDPPPPYRLEVWCPPPKGERLEAMIDQLSQIGASAWRPLQAARAERSKFRADKAERATIESSKQCGRSWLLEIGEWADFDEVLADDRCVLADISGTQATPARRDTVLVFGPEGGWADGEIASFAATGKPVVRFGPHVMRIETAAVVGAGCLLTNLNQGEPR